MAREPHERDRRGHARSAASSRDEQGLGAVAAVVWSTAVAVAGYSLAYSWDALERWVGRTGLIGLAIVVIALNEINTQAHFAALFLIRIFFGALVEIIHIVVGSASRIEFDVRQVGQLMH